MAKKLLQLNVTANWGSTGKIAEGIGLKAMEQGWESYIAYGRYMNPSASKLIKVGGRADVYAHYAKNRFLDKEGLGSISATKELLRHISELKPDIIHLHNIHDHWLNYPILFEYLETIRTPIVWTFHDCWAFTGGCYYYNPVNCNKWQSHCIDCPQKNVFQVDNCKINFSLKKKIFTSLGDRLVITCVSKWLKSEVQKSFFRDFPTKVIGNGIDISVFTPRIDNTRQCRPLNLIGVASVWNELKGLSNFQKLAEKLSPEKFKITLVGLSKSQIRKLHPNILGLERTQNTKDLVNLYNSADILLSLSKGETFGMTILEAMACGIPSIVFDNTAQPELITNDTGIVIENNSIEQVAEALYKIYNGSLNFSKVHCIARARENFDERLQYTKYIDLYNRLLDK